MDNIDFHPIDHCNDTIINTISGPIKLLAPTPGNIIINDIAAALSKTNRFGGHTHWFYSIAQHSILVSLMVPPELKRAALLHDAAAAYIGGITEPVKVAFGPIYEWLDSLWLKAIAQRFNIAFSDFAKIEEYDRKVTKIEQEVLQQLKKPVWKTLCTELAISTDMLMPHEAEDIFMQYYWKYFRLTMGDTNLE